MATEEEMAKQRKTDMPDPYSPEHQPKLAALHVNGKSYDAVEIEQALSSLNTPEVWGYGLEQREGGFVACRVSNRGTVEYYGPKTNAGEHRIESKALALSRAFDAFKAEYAPATKLRYG